ncbi:MAG: hypothetical protein ACK56I_07965, partial [bacterium]
MAIAARQTAASSNSTSNWPRSRRRSRRRARPTRARMHGCARHARRVSARWPRSARSNSNWGRPASGLPIGGRRPPWLPTMPPDGRPMSKPRRSIWRGSTTRRRAAGSISG